MDPRKAAALWMTDTKPPTTVEVRRFAARFQHLGPKTVEADPELRAAVEELSEHADGIMWALTDGAPRFRRGAPGG